MQFVSCRYEPNTIDLSHSELGYILYTSLRYLKQVLSNVFGNPSLFIDLFFLSRYWFTVLSEHLPDLVDKVCSTSVMRSYQIQIDFLEILMTLWLSLSLSHLPRRLLVKVERMMLKEEEMHLHMPFLLTWQGRCPFLH